MADEYTGPRDYLGRPVEPFGPDGNCTLDLCPIEWSVYEYQPSITANAAFIGIFGLVAIVHGYLGWRWKSWWFMGCMVAGCIAEILGYAARIFLHDNPFDFTSFLMNTICITTAPVFFCAGIYVTISQAVVHFDLSLSRIPPKYYYLIFIVCDVISLGIQGSGGALSTVSDGDSQMGVNLALAGLGFQVATLVGFCILFGDYLFRYVRSLHKNGMKIGRRPKLFFWFLSLAIVFTLVRCVFRVDELSEGYDGELIHDEGIFIAMEGVLIVIAVFCLCLGHPGYGFRDDVDSVEPMANEGVMADVEMTSAAPVTGSRGGGAWNFDSGESGDGTEK